MGDVEVKKFRFLELSEIIDNSDDSDILREIYNKTKFEVVLMHLAENVKTPTDILRELSSHKHFQIRKRVAANPATPAAVLHDMSNDYNYSVLEQLILNPNMRTDTAEVIKGKLERRRQRMKENFAIFRFESAEYLVRYRCTKSWVRREDIEDCVTSYYYGGCDENKSYEDIINDVMSSFDRVVYDLVDFIYLDMEYAWQQN